MQITQMLGIYHAELARILHLQCEDVGNLANAQQVIQFESESWCHAEKFIQMFEQLYKLHGGDEVLICNWLRRKNKVLQGIPLYLMVDELRIDDVIHALINA